MLRLTGDKPAKTLGELRKAIAAYQDMMTIEPTGVFYCPADNKGPARLKIVHVEDDNET